MSETFTAVLDTMLWYAKATGGGRDACCQRGACATHLAEGRADFSTIHLGSSLACVPNYGSQELVAAFAWAAIA